MLYNTVEHIINIVLVWYQVNACLKLFTPIFQKNFFFSKLQPSFTQSKLRNPSVLFYGDRVFSCWMVRHLNMKDVQWEI